MYLEDKIQGRLQLITGLESSNQLVAYVLHRQIKQQGTPDVFQI